jgi:2-oxoacid:acceptor oxidoreductase gamma subunit (pyruvate/2-ketoisovalerate family)
MYQIRIHGRGGQGGKTASKIIGTAAFLDGKFVQDFPKYGAERRGAPVVAFTRIDNRPIEARGYIYEPDAIIILDESLLDMPMIEVLNGLKDNGVLIVNSKSSSDEIKKKYKVKAKVIAVPATDIALQTLGKPIPNAVITGAFVKVTKIISMESLKKAIKKELQERGTISQEIIDNNVKGAVKCAEVVK